MGGEFTEHPPNGIPLVLTHSHLSYWETLVPSPFVFFSAVVLFKDQIHFPRAFFVGGFSRKIRIPGFRMDMEVTPGMVGNELLQSWTGKPKGNKNHFRGPLF